ncbi:sugar transporter [Thalassococcus sp. S3]|uniref:sugar transporter n=1 Tax=Thalassococcus sp. S3 TaxID=2017482 RepID=UPI0010241FDA|nr:sugar transporter [Thalassococcus sp. S3]QBF34253.1 sugar transporter [Thalassococcus sp. S3]
MDAVAGPARTRGRHWGIILSFLLLVFAPATATGVYLYGWAADQYASKMGFSVRREDAGSAMELFGGITDLSGSSSTDTDILYEYIQSQELVRAIDTRLDLRTIYSKPENDPVFSFDPEEAIEDLVDYWGRMVRIFYDASTGLIELRVHAFTPQDSQDIAQAIFDESSAMINQISAIAREDTIRYAREELDVAVERLKQARERITEFRSRTQIVDPSADVQGQVGLLNTLQQQLAEALIELDLISETARSGDPRIGQAERRIDVIQKRISEERQKFGVGGEGPGGEDYATLVAEFERLTVDREFAEQAYTAALSAYDAALAEARRKSRYLAAYVRPTLAETAEYPEREILLGLTTAFLLMAWAILILIYYSIRDRR